MAFLFFVFFYMASDALDDLEYLTSHPCLMVKLGAEELFINIAITDWTLSLAEFCV